MDLYPKHRNFDFISDSISMLHVKLGSIQISAEHIMEAFIHPFPYISILFPTAIILSDMYETN
jgi:hypothetical protein